MIEIRQLDQDIGCNRNRPGFVLGIGILRNMKQLCQLSLFDVPVFPYAPQILKNHNNNLRHYYGISVFQILTFICNTDIMKYKNEEKRE